MPATNAQTALVEAGEPEIPEEEEERAQLRALAAKFNVTLMPTGALLSTLGRAILGKMIQRTGDSIYQILTVSMPYFPIALLEDYLPTESRQEEEGTIWWELSSMDALLSMVPILSSASDSNCAGLSKYFRAKSQPVFRVIATLMPDMEITYAPIDSDVGTVTFTGQYALVTEMGESHLPKDKNKREMLFDPETIAAVMEQALSDAQAFAGAGHPLSPGWWRQLGREQRAQEVEYALAHPRAASASSRQPRVRGIRKQKARQPRQPRFTTETYEIEAIIDEKKVTSKAKVLFQVRWVGWTDPTWEPLLVLKDTEALQEWREARLR